MSDLSGSDETVGIEARIEQAYQNAKDNGYNWDEWDVSDIVFDLLQYNVDFENCDSNILYLQVQEWRETRGKTH